ncbi:MAG TPA: hypothetical protein PLB18_22880 [Acidobacteriota bacterium]|nr:hypothetical protein [Acidobacteriota bacterium]HMW00023.1 hypothetical protein [Acidobacteriota bacterium]HNC46521.1 hypothetical protein [Acidobacteriota bacterium]HND22233.1 hypothetical protein [Acidobacteriota bacterium]HNH84658.1 hypothetical protein [Acidobacteriota bacterium]
MRLFWIVYIAGVILSSPLFYGYMKKYEFALRHLIERELELDDDPENDKLNEWIYDNAVVLMTCLLSLSWPVSLPDLFKDSDGL